MPGVAHIGHSKSESIHTLTIDTLDDTLFFGGSRHRGLCQGLWLEVNSLKHTHGLSSSSVRRSQCSNIFSSKTAWPINAKFYVEPPWVGGTKFC